MSRAKHWVFTLNNPSDYDYPKRWAKKEKVVYAIWQVEIGENGTEHLQGYVSFAQQIRFNRAKQLCQRAHWEVRKGTHTQAKEYASKQDTRAYLTEIGGPFEIGDDSGIAEKSGTRTDLNLLHEDLKAKKSLAEIADNHFGAFLKYSKGIKEYIGLQAKHREFDTGEKPKIYIFWGPSGTGKSRRAKEEFPGAYWKVKSDWWQDYSGQEVVVLDEFYGWEAFDYLLRLLDFNHLEVPIKGASVPLGAKTFVFTSNEVWYKWYKKVDRYRVHALARRIWEWGTILYINHDETVVQHVPTELPNNPDYSSIYNLEPPPSSVQGSFRLPDLHLRGPQ